MVDCFLNEGLLPIEEEERAVHVAEEVEGRRDIHIQHSDAVSEVNSEFADNRDDDDGKNCEVNTFAELGAEGD